MRIAFALSALVSGVAMAVPGAAPVELCDYSQPEYSAREVAAVRSYGQCLGKASDNRTVNVASMRCNDMVNAHSGPSSAVGRERLIECGSSPDHKYCSVSNAIGWCTSDVEGAKRFPDLYPCDDLVRRYPDLGPVMKACMAAADARKGDMRERADGEAKCKSAHPDGLAVVTGKCRKPRTVLPPSAPRPPQPS